MQLFPSAPRVSGHALPAAYAAVAAGGAVGASLRWVVGTTYHVDPGGWPWPTLFVNLLGCLLIGVASKRIDRGSLHWDAIVTGMLGGFTTMSSFALELNHLVDAERTGLAVVYGVATLAVGTGAVLAGQSAARLGTQSVEEGRAS